MNNSEQPIIPMPYQSQDGSIQHDVYFGLTKREYFAGLAMQGILSSRGLQEALNQDRTKWEDCAVEYADLLLAALEKKK